jgi:cell wall-associated NlpC family hydrolase
MRATIISLGLVDEALEELIGLPFERGGRGPDAYDCWGLVLALRRRLGLREPPDIATGTLTREQAHALFALQSLPLGWRRVPLSPGGIVFAQCAAHAGVYVAGRIVHAQTTAGVVAWTLGRWMTAFGVPECWEAS